MSAPARIIGRMGSGIPPGLLRTAAAQAGIVSRRQALGAGLPPSTIASKVNHKLWQAVFPGVYYTFTGEAPWEARRWAAVLYAGPGALLSHETAAEILNLTDNRSPVIHVAVPANRRVKAPPGVKVHYASVGYPLWRPQPGVPPHTFYAETIIDLVAAADNLDDVVAWVSRGIAKRRVSGTQLKMTIMQRGRFRWRGQLREVIDQVAGGSHFPLEFRYDRDVERAHGLPPAAKQAKFTKPDGTMGFRDRHYREYGLIVELDGREFHPEEQRGLDRDRDNEAAAAVGATLRYGWAAVTRASCETASQIHRALRRGGYQGELRPCSASCRAFLAA